MKNINSLVLNLQKMAERRKKDCLIARQQTEAPRCKVCGDRGFIMVDGKAIVCSCIKQHSLEKHYQYANITPEIRDCCFESFRLDYYEGGNREAATRALMGARQFVDNYLVNQQVSGLLFTGDVGSGKTYLAAAVANCLLARGIKVLFLVVPDFLDELRATYNRNPGEEGNLDDVTLLKGIRKVDVLILDDLGVHNYTSWTCNKLYSLLNFRLNYQLPVVITTNLSLGNLEEFLGERTTSRIVQMCKIYKLSVDKDIRHLKSLKNER